MKEYDVISTNNDRYRIRVKAEQFRTDLDNDFIMFFIGADCVAMFPVISIFGVIQIQKNNIEYKNIDAFMKDNPN